MNLIKEIEKILPKVGKILTQERMQQFLQIPYIHLDEYDFGLGTMIRLKLLGSKNTLYKAFIEIGITDRYIMTMIIIRKFYRSMHAQLFEF